MGRVFLSLAVFITCKTRPCGEQRHLLCDPSGPHPSRMCAAPKGIASETITRGILFGFDPSLIQWALIQNGNQ